MNVFSIILLALFALSIVITYLYTRRGQATPLASFIVSSLVNVISVTLFCTSVQLSFDRALLNGLIFGLLFSLLAVASAAFFRQNEHARRTSEVQPDYEPPAE